MMAGEESVVARLRHAWQLANDAAAAVHPSLALHTAGVSADDINRAEQRLDVRLPTEIRAAMMCHNGRPRSDRAPWGRPWQLATTDLLPIDEWQPFESVNVEVVAKFAEIKVSDERTDHISTPLYTKDSVQKLLAHDLRDDIMYYSTHERVPVASTPGLLVIGRGMADYDQEVLLGLHTQMLFYVTMNIPEGMCLGTFQQWLEHTGTFLQAHKADISDALSS